MRRTYAAFDNCNERFSPQCPNEMECPEKDKDCMLAFYDYPAENWQHIQITNPVEELSILSEYHSRYKIP
ncbi:MAG: hypothetical protein E6Q62_05360 [Nitrosomonas sp.]|nr:MAG: hypothetical protein E6Q62_05360 [Nitrosomonas sp.]